MMFPNSKKVEILDGVTDDASRYLALFTDLPNEVDGSGGTEVSAGWYARQLLSASDWSDDAPTSDGAIVRRNDVPYAFSAVTGADVTIVGWGIYDASSGGTLQAFGRVVGPEGGISGITIPVTQTIDVAANGIALVIGGSISSISINIPGSGIVTISAVQTGNYTASIGELVRYDASSAPFTLFAPPSPSLGDEWAISEVGVSSGSVTINGNGNDITEPGTTVVASFVTTSPSAALEWYFDGTVWRQKP